MSLMLFARSPLLPAPKVSLVPPSSRIGALSRDRGMAVHFGGCSAGKHRSTVPTTAKRAHNGVNEQPLSVLAQVPQEHRPEELSESLTPVPLIVCMYGTRRRQTKI